MKASKLSAVIKSALISSLLMLPQFAAASDNADKKGFTSLEMTQQSLEQLPDCLSYRINGLTLRVIYYGYGYYYFFTPNVTHNSPDMLSMSHREIDYLPYKQLDNILSGALQRSSQKAGKQIAGAEMGGGRYQEKKWGDHQAGQFTDSTVIGNPAAMIIDAFSWSGYNPPSDDAGGNGGSVTSAEADSYMDDWNKDPGSAKLPDKFASQMEYTAAMQMVANTPVVQWVKDLTQELDSMLSSMDVKIGDSLFCPVNATPFEPYYFSGSDALMWRTGFPVSDFEYASTILDPDRDDGIKPTASNSQSGSDDETWGYVYPRTGSVNQIESSKLGAVAAVRSMYILKDGGNGRVYNEPDYKFDGMGFAKIYPEKSQCHKNVANTGIMNDDEGNYAWNVWTAHTCDLFPVGIPVLMIPLNIQVTSEIPD